MGTPESRDIYNHLKSQGYADIYTRYKSGSTISWAISEARERETGSTLIFQTGINNITNTGQDNNNILHQFKKMIKENHDKKIILTSILPAANRFGEAYTRVSEVNEELKRLAINEGVTYIDLEGVYKIDNKLNFEMYRNEGKFLHLNDAGNECFIKKVDEEIRRTGGSFLKLTQVFWRTRPNKNVN